MTQLDPLRREAVARVQQLILRPATEADMAELVLWRSQNPTHAAAFDEASRLWQAFGPAGENLRRQGRASAGLAKQRPARISRRVALGGVAAASAAAVAIVHPPLALWPSLAEMEADYRTATGEQRNVVFANDISIHLNTQTSIALRSRDGDAAQVVELVAGEASFATGQLRHALAVIAADGRTVGGAARFDVRRDGPSVWVSCLDGQIQVEQRHQGMTIIGGQQVRYDADGFGSVVAMDRDIVTSWQRGILIFRSTPLAEVVEEINRYRPGKVIVMSTALGRRPVSGRFRIDRMDEILVSIKQVFGATARSLPGGIVLLS